MSHKSARQEPSHGVIVRAYLRLVELQACPELTPLLEAELAAARDTLTAVPGETLGAILAASAHVANERNLDLIEAAEEIAKETADEIRRVTKATAIAAARDRRELEKILGARCPLQERSLFEALMAEKGKSLAEWELMEIVFRVVVDAPEENNRVVEAAKQQLTTQLRQIVRRLNGRLTKRKVDHRVIFDDVEGSYQLEGPAAVSNRWTVDEVKKELRGALEQYETVETQKLWDAFKEVGVRPSTFRNACKQLNVRRSRKGFGPNCVYTISLPTETR